MATQEPPGLSRIDPADPAAPYFRLLAALRTPLTLRELMIQPVRQGYIGQPGAPPPDLPPSAADLYPSVAVTEAHAPSSSGPIRCQVFTPPGPDAGRRPMMLYAHGGGFTVGASEDTAAITSRIAQETGHVVVSLNYRLAPEWPFPAAVEDCLSVLRWLRAEGSALGGDPARIVAAGDSAGANLAAALPLAARDAGLVQPEAVVLLCPITDFNVERHASFERLAPRGIVYDTAFVGYIRGAYLVAHRHWSHPHASPACGDLAAYPPTLIVSGDADPMIDDNTAYARLLRAAGRVVEHHVSPGMPHGFYFFPGLLPQGEAAFAAIAAFLGRAPG